MLNILECFLIKFTIPTFLDTNALKMKLSETEWQNLSNIEKMNQKLLSYKRIRGPKAIAIRGYFLKRLGLLLGKGEHTHLLPTALQQFPTLKELTILFLDNKKMLNNKNLKKFSLDFRNELLDYNTIKIIQPFGILGFKHAYNFMQSILEILELEMNHHILTIPQLLKALTVAIICEEPSFIEKYISQLPDLTGYSNELLDVLYWTISTQQRDIFFQLLEIKSDFKIKDHAETLLTYATRYADFTLFKYLLPFADRIKSEENNLLLHMAAKSGNSEMVNQVLSIPVDPELRSQKGLLAIHYAIASGNIPLFERLISLVKKELTRDDHCNLFCLAAINGKINAINYLIQQGYNINAKNSDNKTVLEAVIRQLNMFIAAETTRWHKIFLSYNKINVAIQFLLDTSKSNDSLKTTVIRTINKMEDISRRNTQLKTNIITILDHPSVSNHLSFYDRYIRGQKTLHAVVTTSLIFILLGTVTALAFGFEKYYFDTKTKEDNNSDRTILYVGSGLTIFDLFLFMAIFTPKNKFPGSNFFRRARETRANENTHSDQLSSIPQLDV